MRIISQDKMRDINYKNNDFYIFEQETQKTLGQYEICSFEKVKDNPILLGEYSSLAKALKVMEMIREAHVGKSQKILVTEEEGKIEEVINMNYYFYMPKDDDVK